MKQNKIKKAVTINMIAKYSTVIVQLIINAILSRILAPEAFGTVAIITVFTNFFSILSDMGICSAIIQNKELSERDYKNIFSFTFYLGIILGTLFIVISFLITWIYKDNIYIPMCSLLFFSIFFNTFNMVPNAILLKEQKFLEIGIRTITVTLISGILTIVFAIAGADAYSLILNSIITSTLIFIWNFSKLKIKFSFTFEKESLNKIKDFSIFQFGFSFINYFSRNADNLLIGAIMGKIPLAYYDKSYKLMLYPINMLSNVISPVLHPILSNYQKQKEIIYEEYMKIIKFLAIIAVFISAFCYLNASEIILIMFGKNWEGSIECFKILSFSIFSQMLCATTGSIYQSIGKVKELFRVGLVNTIITILFILFGTISKKLEIIALFITIAYNCHALISFYVLMVKIFEIKAKKFIKEISKELIILMILIISCLLYSYTNKNIIISLTIKSIYLGIIYIISLIISGEFKYIKKLVKK